MTDDVHPILRPTAADRSASVLRVLGSLLPPGISGVFLELITSVIPHQREERLVRYLTVVGRRLRAAEGKLEEVSSRLGPEGLALFEDGAQAAVRATTEERIDRIARIVAEGMSGSEATAEQQREILQLLNSVTDADLIYLAKWLPRPLSPMQELAYAMEEGSRKATAVDLRALSRSEGLAMMEGIADARAVSRRRSDKLAGLGLLSRRPAEASIANAFKTGKVRVPGDDPQYDITEAGRLILRKVDLATWDPPPVAYGYFQDEGAEKN